MKRNGAKARAERSTSVVCTGFSPIPFYGRLFLTDGKKQAKSPPDDNSRRQFPRVGGCVGDVQ
jgi:hypothetical protein